MTGSISIYWGNTGNQATQLETLRCETSYQGKFEEFTLNGKKTIIGIVTLIYKPSFHWRHRDVAKFFSRFAKIDRQQSFEIRMSQQESTRELDAHAYA